LTRKHISNFIDYIKIAIDLLIDMMHRTKVGITTIILVLFCLINVPILHGSADIASLYLFLPDDTIYLGDSFQVTFQINVTQSIGGWELSFSYDPLKLQVTQITAGAYWVAMFDEGSIDQSNGSVSSIQSWSTGPYPDNNHILFNITFDTLQDGFTEINIQDINVTTPTLEFIMVEPMELLINVIDPDDQTSGDDTNDSSEDEGQSQHDTGTDEPDPDNQTISNDENNTETTPSDDEEDLFNESFLEDLEIILEEQLDIIIDYIETIKILPKPLNTSYLVHYQMDSIIHMVVYDSVTHMILPTKKMTDQYINIDIDYDGIWDYSYDIVTGSVEQLELSEEIDTYEILFPWLIGIILIIILLGISYMIYKK